MPKHRQFPAFLPPTVSIGRESAPQSVLYEIRNHLAVAVANVEAFRDGVLEPSEVRLDAVLHALSEAEMLLNELPMPNAVAP